MISTSLLSVFAMTLGGGHAELHPANTNVFVEIHNVHEVLTAYREAPLARLIEDPEVQGFVAKLTGQETQEVTLPSLTKRALVALREELPDFVSHVLDLAGDVEHASCSIAGVNFDGLRELLAASEGELSEDEIERLGEIRIRVVLDFSSATTAQEAAALIRSGAQSTEDEPDYPWTQVKFVQRSDHEASEWSVHSAATGRIDLSLLVADEAQRVTLQLAFFGQQLEPGVPSKTLASTKAYRDSSAHMTGEQGVNIVSSYTSLAGLDEIPALLALLPELPEQVPGLAAAFTASAFPAGRLEVRAQTRLFDGRFITDIYERSFAAADSPSITSDEPVTRSNFRMAPADAVAVWATNLDKDGLRDALLQALTLVSGEDTEKLLVTLDQEYGLQPVRDLITPLGGQVLFYNLPVGGIGMPKMFFALELDDSAAFARGLDALVSYLGEVGGDLVEIHSKPYRKQPFVSLSPGKDLVELTAGTNAGGIAAMTPAFVSLNVSVGVLEDRAIIGLSSMYVKREIKRLLKAKPGSQHVVMTMDEEFPSGTESYGLTDWGAIIAGLYDSVRGFLPLIQQAADFSLPFSIDEMPSGALFSRYIAPSVNWTEPVPGGKHQHWESAFGPEVFFTSGAGIVSALLLAGTTRSPSVVREQPTEQVIESHRTSQEDDGKQQATRNSMQDLKMALQVYKAEHGDYPGSLNDLLQTSEASPEGLLESASVLTDGWGAPFHYEGVPPTFHLWSSGPDGVNAKGGGDDLVLGR